MSADKALFSIIVAAHGRERLLMRLLESLVRCREDSGLNMEILVVDSTPAKELGAIAEECAHLGAIRIQAPLSVRKKRNIGASEAQGIWLLFIDSDCEVPVGFLSAYKRAVDSHDGLRIAAGPTIFRGAETPFTHLIADSSLLAPFRRPSEAGRTLLWSTTSNLLVNREVFMNAGGFREKLPFLLGGDDTDLCLRLRNAGYEIVAVPEAECFHSWATWGHPWAVMKRSARWGWMHSHLLRDYPQYRRIDSPGLPAHCLATIIIAAAGIISGIWLALFLPVIFATLAILFHAILAASSDKNHWRAFRSDLALAAVELPFGFGRACGSLASGSLVGIFYRLDNNDSFMDVIFPETVRALWSDHLAFLVAALLVGGLF
jgi:hypothetical protein